MKYIAYGSNMVEEQMAYRCPTAKLLGRGMLPNYRLEFYNHATVEPDDTCTEGVPVAVWDIGPDDEEALDFYEGYPHYYGKEETTVHMADGSEIKGMMYVMCDSYKYGRSSPSYCDGIRQAYKRLGLSSEIDTVLEPAIKRGWDR